MKNIVVYHSETPVGLAGALIGKRFEEEKGNNVIKRTYISKNYGKKIKKTVDSFLFNELTLGEVNNHVTKLSKFGKEIRNLEYEINKNLGDLDNIDEILFYDVYLSKLEGKILKEKTPDNVGINMLFRYSDGIGLRIYDKSIYDNICNNISDILLDRFKMGGSRPIFVGHKYKLENLSTTDICLLHLAYKSEEPDYFVFTPFETFWKYEHKMYIPQLITKGEDKVENIFENVMEKNNIQIKNKDKLFKEMSLLNHKDFPLIEKILTQTYKELQNNIDKDIKTFKF